MKPPLPIGTRFWDVSEESGASRSLESLELNRLVGPAVPSTL
jgi:hypothetical protein